MSKWIICLLLSILALSLVGCGKNPTAPIVVERVIVRGVVVNPTDTTWSEVKINDVVVATNLAPGEDRVVDLGTGPSDFYTAADSPNVAKRSFTRYITDSGTVSIDQYQRRGWIWMIGRGFYTATFKETDPAKY